MVGRFIIGGWTHPCNSKEMIVENESYSQGSGWKETMFEAAKWHVLLVRIGKPYGFRSYISFKECCSLHGCLLSCIFTACLCFTRDGQELS